ncbi:MAG TPA: hypothetical protein VGL61_10685 [Kofleriaceae bacterium]|jgi:hypothetical protein
MRFCLAIALALLTACLDQQPTDTATTSQAATTVVLRTWTWGCADADDCSWTRELGIGAQTYGAVGYLWSPEKNVDSFVPPTASGIQVFLTAGDAGGSLTNDFPTFYAWIIEDGSSVYQVWRVIKDGTTDTKFLTKLNTDIGYAGQFESLKTDTITGNGYGKLPNPPPPIGPGGKITFSVHYTNAMINAAAPLANVSNDAFATLNVDEAP